jgi:hypothetical protein
MTGSHRVYRRKCTEGMEAPGIEPAYLHFNYYAHIRVMRRELDDDDNAAATTITDPDRPVTMCLARDMLSLRAIVHEASHAAHALKQRDYDWNPHEEDEWIAHAVEDITAWVIGIIMRSGIRNLPMNNDDPPLTFYDPLIILMERQSS